MSTRDLVCVALALMATGCASADRMVNAEPGARGDPAEISGWDISVAPDGVGLPPGRGTAAIGATVYEQKCQACHGATGAGSRTTGWSAGTGRWRARHRCARSGATGPTRPPCSTTSGARCPTSSRSRSRTTRCMRSLRICSASTASSARAMRAGRHRTTLRRLVRHMELDRQGPDAGHCAGCRTFRPAGCRRAREQHDALVADDASDPVAVAVSP